MTRPAALCTVFVALLALGAGCTQYPARAPFLCCVLTCTGSLVKAKKEAPVNDGGRWRCNEGQPIDYNGACAAEEGAECDIQGSESFGNPGSRGGSSAGTTTTSHASSAPSSRTGPSSAATSMATSPDTSVAPSRSSGADQSSSQ